MNDGIRMADRVQREPKVIPISDNNYWDTPDK